MKRRALWARDARRHALLERVHGRGHALRPYENRHPSRRETRGGRESRMTKVLHTRSAVDLSISVGYDSVVANVRVSRIGVESRRTSHHQRDNRAHLATSSDCGNDSCSEFGYLARTSRSYVNLVEDCKMVPRNASRIRSTRTLSVIFSGCEKFPLGHDTHNESYPLVHDTRSES